eukprot:COSAG01_NODE_980_length_12356_cov_77.766093_1_plen_168_part_00
MYCLCGCAGHHCTSSCHRETFTATPRRSRLVGAGPSMPKRSSSSHPGEPRHLLLRIYRSPTASGGQQHSTEYGVRSPGKAACSIPFLPCICSNLHIFSGSVKAAGSTVLLTDGLLLLVQYVYDDFLYNMFMGVYILIMKLFRCATLHCSSHLKGYRVFLVQYVYDDY